MAPATTAILIPAGTIVSELRNSPTQAGVVEERYITLCGDVHVDASRLPDGSWGYSLGRHVYACAGGSAQFRLPDGTLHVPHPVNHAGV